MKFLKYSIYILLILGGVYVIVLRSNIFPLFDYLEYWSASQLDIHQQNPYNPDQLYTLQITQGWQDPFPILMWNPPPSIGLMLPFAILPYAFSRAFYFLFSIVTIFVATLYLWEIYGGGIKLRWLALLLTMSFGPVLQMLKLGQINTWSLVGLIGFLYFLRKNKIFTAGLFSSLTLVKPHIVYLFWIALILWSLSKRYWSFWVGVTLGVAIPLAVAWLPNPLVISQYLFRTSNQPLDNWITATLGSQLRLIFGPEHFWLQFVPSLAGSAIFLLLLPSYWKTWTWERCLPWLVLGSLATSSYGWNFDNSIGIIAVVAAAAAISKVFPKIRHEKKLFPFVCGLCLLYFGLSLFLGFVNLPQHHLWWGASALLLLAWLFQRLAPIETIPAGPIEA